MERTSRVRRRWRLELGFLTLQGSQSGVAPYLFCALHLSNTQWNGGWGDAISSVRSDIFIATRAARSDKLRRSGMFDVAWTPPNSQGAKVAFMPLLAELGQPGIERAACELQHGR